MGWLEDMLGITAANNQNNALESQQKSIDSSENRFGAYGNPLLEWLSSTYQNPGANSQGQFRGMENDVGDWLKQAMGSVVTNVGGRGLENSSWAQGAVQGVGEQAGSMLADKRADYMNNLQSYQLNLIQAMMGLLNRQPANYMPLADAYGQQASSAMGTIGGIGTALGGL